MTQASNTADGAASDSEPRTPKKGEVAQLTEQLIDLFLSEDPPLAAGIGPLFDLGEEDCELIWNLGVGLHKQGRFVEAERVFGRLCRLQGLQKSQNYKALGAARQRQGQWRTAIAAYEIAAILAHDDPEPSFYAAECLRQLGLSERAQEALDISIRLAGDRPEYAPLKERALAIASEK